jgi:cytoskeletal protein CcmA (bactofilin family)
MLTRPFGWKQIDIGESEEASASPAPEAPHPIATFIEPGCEVEGRLVLSTSIQIDGEFRGAIVSQQTVTVGEEAAVEATIEARTVDLHGAVVGDVTASREVLLRSGSRLHGAVSAPSFVVERGAFFTGEIRMYRPEVAARAGADAGAEEQSRGAANIQGLAVAGAEAGHPRETRLRSTQRPASAPPAR